MNVNCPESNRDAAMTVRGSKYVAYRVRIMKGI